eukprot:CAMPEP_0113825172 /NCGR_PEP_ID=MMETSP0328-20130328/3615_1 /TAXON_ID=39455 /ORGANISM="Alexandrium minutum" /LENGTH=159 /DNA_ID=CAMNT_0000793123 /DNA_START=77 /DNA_END=555 /DNA_ORIENTATION=- /assembly_acc=CAM_ASM_000350
MVKKTLRQRAKEGAGKGSNKPKIQKKLDKNRKKRDKKKARSGKKVDDLAEQLAKSTSVSLPPMEAADPGEGSKKKGGAKQGDVDMAATPASQQPTASREELRKKLRAKLATGSLDRTQNLTKNIRDSRGQLKRREKSGNKMDTAVDGQRASLPLSAPAL